MTIRQPAPVPRARPHFGVNPPGPVGRRDAALTPGQRAAMGLPEVGWERVVWGGLGLDDDAPS